MGRHVTSHLVVAVLQMSLLALGRLSRKSLRRVFSRQLQLRVVPLAMAREEREEREEREGKGR